MKLDAIVAGGCAAAYAGTAAWAAFGSNFVAPFGACIEYTSEVQRVPDDYKVGAPEDWKWPPGRGDHWGIASRDNDKLIASGDAFPFRALAV